MANYTFQVNPIPDVENGHTFTRDNFTQMYPHTAILTGKTGIKFVSCKMVNCDIPADAECIGCRPYHTSFCSHTHPDWVAYGLSVCGDTCEHLVDTDTVTIDGVVVDTIRHYSDKAVS